jgi:hypothetical protein
MPRRNNPNFHTPVPTNIYGTLDSTGADDNTHDGSFFAPKAQFTGPPAPEAPPIIFTPQKMSIMQDLFEADSTAIVAHSL